VKKLCREDSHRKKTSVEVKRRLSSSKGCNSDSKLDISEHMKCNLLVASSIFCSCTDQSKLAEYWFQQLCFPIWMIFFDHDFHHGHHQLFSNGILPVVSATTQDPFPDLPFQAFAELFRETLAQGLTGNRTCCFILHNK